MDVASIDVRGDDPREVVVAVFGEIDLEVHDEFLNTLHAAIGIPGVKKVVVDLSKTTFMDSIGIHVLIAGRAAASDSDVEFTVTGATGIVRSVLGITGVLAALTGEHPDEEGRAPAG